MKIDTARELTLEISAALSKAIPQFTFEARSYGIAVKDRPSADYLTRIKQRRLESGLSLADLAAKCETGAQTIHRLENDQITVSVTWLYKIADALGIDARDLLV